jgi:iron complex transport system substrate-binding protein
VSPAAALCAACLAVAPGLAYAPPLSVRDDSGMQVTLPAPARRVITLAPGLTELVFAAGAGGRLVGADSASDYPVESRVVPRVGDASGIDLERVLALRPDLVLAWLSGNKPTDLARLRKLSVPLFLSEPRSLDDVPRTLRIVGNLLDSETTANKQAVAFEQRLAALRARYAQGRMLTVFVEIWHQPLMTVNREQLVSDVLRTCAAHNIFGDLPALAGPVALERVLAADPDGILSATGVDEDIESWRRLRSLRATRDSRILRVDPDALTRATPRILDAAEQICGWLARLRS